MDFSDPEQVNSLLFTPRSANIRSGKSAKFAAQFKDRLWRICTELNGIGPAGRCRDGEFWLNAGETVQTPFGNRTRHGYIIQEVSQDGRDLSTRPVAFGPQTLRRAAELYGSVVNLPAPRGRGRPRKVAQGRQE